MAAMLFYYQINGLQDVSQAGLSYSSEYLALPSTWIGRNMSTVSGILELISGGALRNCISFVRSTAANSYFILASMDENTGVEQNFTWQIRRVNTEYLSSGVFGEMPAIP